ncbi:hypothetical protein [Myroides pelagicus]|uniref:Uncharacterized protein n=1 Tax=Myroides pelagicus TaxID=270914 RepID=A0A7K1GQ79_9FLAO|nr:hypothetical protein [Myroides pelagicus]MTH31017.1 hypothetical protein [Myroides pelagicus]
MPKLLLYTFILFLIMGKMSAQSTVANSYDKLIFDSYQKDQKIRMELDSLLENKNRSNEELVSLLSRIEKIDFDNQCVILPILDQYLEQKIELTDMSLSHVYYIIQHADGDIQSKYAVFVSELFDKGLVDNQEFAWFIDRLNVRKNKAQSYGFQVKSWADTKERFPYPISSSSEENCQQINLTSSKEYLEENFIGVYLPQYLTKDEFVVFGHVRGITQNLKIVIDEDFETKVNDKGFYVIKLKKNERNSFHLCLKKNDIKFDCKTITIDGKDWEEIDFFSQSN